MSDSGAAPVAPQNLDAEECVLGAMMLSAGRAIEAVLERGRIGETYHVGTGIERSIEEIADGVLGALGKPSSLKTIVADRPGHDRRYVLDFTKIRTELGWTPTVDFDAALGETVAWYADHRSWWEPLRDRAPVDESAWQGT